MGTFILLKPFRHICFYFFYLWYEISYLNENPSNSSPSGRPNVTEEALSLSSETPISLETPLYENKLRISNSRLQNKLRFSKTNSNSLKQNPVFKSNSDVPLKRPENLRTYVCKNYATLEIHLYVAITYSSESCFLTP